MGITEITINNLSAEQSMAIVRDLRSTGFVQGQDFDFKYSQAHYDWYGDAEQASATTFMFYTKETATFFNLKYQ